MKRAVTGLVLLAALATGTADADAPPLPTDAGTFPPSLEFPFELEETRGGIFVPVTVNGRVGRALLDTGAGHTIVAADLARARGVVGRARFSGREAGLRGPAVPARVELGLPGASLGLRPVRLMNLGEVSRAYGRRVDAVLGQDVLARYRRVALDYEARQVRLVSPGEGVDGAACPLDVPFELEEERGGILVDQTVNGRRATALVDTGAGHTVVATDLLRAGAPAVASTGVRAGLGGRLMIWADLAVGGERLGRQPVQPMSLDEASRAYGRRVDVLLGQDVLARRPRLLIDFEARRLGLVSRAAGECPASSAGSTMTHPGDP